jgi:serine/threonine-protein kinase
MTTKYKPGARISEYLLEQCLGAGAFGEVWQARHHIWESDRVAIKLPTEPEYVRFLQREGVVVHGLRHPNIIRVLGLDPYADTPYLIMELVKGPSLRDVIAEHPAGLPVATAVVVLRGLLRAMAAAHAAQVIHRDLKPGNVLLNLDGRPLAALTVDDVKVGDFGLGVGNADTLRAMVEQSVSIERDAQSATISGTLAYMAPEVRDGQQPPGPRSDLYSIGVILFEMLTGGRPAGAELPSAVRTEVPEALDEVFGRLYTRFENRFADAHAVLRDLDTRLEPRRAATVHAGAPPHPAHAQQTCPRCQKLTDADDQFCTHCGAQLIKSVRRCTSCGGYPGPYDNFCIFCGTALASSGE